MANNIVDVIVEIVNRLETARKSGTLTDVKRIKVGSSEEARKLNDYPIINVNIPNGEETPIETTRRATNLLTIVISLIVNKEDDASNNLYNVETSSGVLILLEKMLDVLDKNTSGSVDLSFASTAHDLRSISYDIDSSNDGIVQANVTLTVETIQFSLGGRFSLFG